MSMGYGNIKHIKVENGVVVDCEMFDEKRADSSKKQLPPSRVEKIAYAQKKRAEKELKEFINKATRGDFIEI